MSRQPGNGRSYIPGTAFSVEMMAKDTLGLMDALGIGKAHLVGGSLGACCGASGTGERSCPARCFEQVSTDDPDHGKSFIPDSVPAPAVCEDGGADL